MTVDIEAGTLFIANCGNLTMFYNFGFRANMNENLGTDIITGIANRMAQYNATAQARTFGLGVSVIGDVNGRSNRPPDDTPPEEVPTGKDPNVTNSTDVDVHTVDVNGNTVDNTRYQ